MQALTLLLSFLFLMISCSPEPEKKDDDDSVPTITQNNNSIQGCTACHDKKLDPAHDFDCTECHQGNNKTNQKRIAHLTLVAKPAHPNNMMKSCGKCHKKTVQDNSHSLHFTVKNEVNLVRKAFGATEALNSLVEIPVSEVPNTILALTDDLLRRRCLRCHMYYTGDRYPGIVRGSGCASCHLSFYEGKLTSHNFLKTPEDTQCLQCHYGNYVGADYYGRFEHDMNDEYRTPYTTTNDYFRPFGLEFHQLQADIHQQKGLVCLDCHNGAELMGKDSSVPHCSSCHDEKRLAASLPDNIRRNPEGSFTLHSLTGNKDHLVPLMHHPTHNRYRNIAACQVCHARWSFNDQQTSLLRSDLDEYEDFSRLTAQGSFEVEKLLLNNLDYEADEMDPVMSDKISGKQYPGLWYKGYRMRRWEEVPIGRDDTGKLQVMRPILDLHLSWINEDEEVIFDSIPASKKDNGMYPYTPHTTGKAGLFYKERIEQFLRSEKEALK